jgi:CheY-like chemotaxis protein
MAKILVVDDEMNFTNLVKLHLGKRYKVITANSGDDALQKAEKEHPDVITLDILMPGMNGIDVLKKLKQNRKTKNIPVILLTIADKMEKGRAFDLIHKPLDENRLINSIERALN